MILHYICKMIALPLNLWYDINCRYKFHAMAWAKEKTDVLGSLISDWICNVMGFPLPSFHGSMHDANCQMNNSYRTILEAGLGTGEPPEYAWSHEKSWPHSAVSIITCTGRQHRALGDALERFEKKTDHENFD